MDVIYKVFIVILTALLPGVEARGAIPVGIGLGLNPLTVFLLSYFASSIVCIPLVYLLSFIEEKIVNRIGFLERIYNYVVYRARSKAEKIRKYRIIYLGLALYVAIPLPLTGVWTGSLIAYLIGLDKFKSIIAIFLGNLVASLIILSLTYTVTLIL